ncbi:MAG: helix-turn-helix transcriptional regulator [Alphaproteobacteria bacterium]|nr:helix-turn-helix transcriptional regulator [Alphaproteobacteria bacterium]
MARALTGLSRQDLYNHTGIATSTIDTWESGRVELSKKGAERVCSSLYELGICCTSEWLLTGEGMPPHFMDDIEKLMYAGRITASTAITSFDKNTIPRFLDADLKKELTFFLELHRNALFCIVQNKIFGTRYMIGDCLAGIISDPFQLTGQFVILQKSDQNTMVGYLHEIQDNVAKISVECKNDCMFVEFQKIAKILWHRIG